MKRIGLIVLALILIYNSAGVLAEEVWVASVDDIAEALGVTVDYDEKTDSLFVNGIDTAAVKGKETTLYVNGFKCEYDAGVIKENGTFYLSDAVVEAEFGLTASSDGSLIKLQKEVPAVEISPDKTYAIINCQSGKALTAEGNSLYTSEFTKAEGQKFKILDSGTEGFYHIRTVETDRNLDVYNHWMDPGVKIIVWDQGTGDNQKFSIESVEGGYYITARGRALPIDEYEEGIVQNAVHGGESQKWQIVEII